MRISKPVGIYFGNRNSVAAMMDLTDSKIIMHSDKFGRKLTPSVVAYDFGKDQILVGQPAFRRRGTEPEPIVSVKREMANPNKKLVLGPFEKTPVEISALILQETVRKIREELDKQSADSRFIVDRAIITVPAYFNADQKEATCEAGKKAGLEVMEILYEPTAAVIHCSWKHNITDATFMVYDFGAETFDVSIIRQLHGEPQVLGIAGDNFLGDDDLDRLLAQYIYDILEKEEGYVLDFDLKNSKEDQLKFTKLIMFAEGIKKELSTKDVHFAEKQDLFEDKNGQMVIVEMEITRDTFNNLIEEKVNATIPCCEEALRKAKEKSDVTIDQIDYIVMVGGSTKIPLVQQKVKEAFCSGKAGKPKAKCAEPIVDEPDLAVAMGAAIQAANYGLDMYDDNKRIVINLRNPGGTSRSTYNLSGEVKALNDSINIEGGSIRISFKKSEYNEEKELGNNGKFSFRKIPLQINTINNLKISVFNRNKQELATFVRSIVQDKEHKAIGGGLISPNQLAKPFCIERIKENKLVKEIIFPEGTVLPADGKFEFFTIDQSDIIRIALYEENRVLKVIEADIDSSLPAGTPVEFFLNCDEKHYITGHYKIKGEQFTLRIEPPPPTPLPTKQQYENLLYQFAEAISYLTAGQKLIIQGKKKKICKDIEGAFQFNDVPKLRQKMAELEGLINEIKIDYRKEEKKIVPKVRLNPFEYLRINPDADKSEIIEIGRELAFDASPEEKKLIRQAVSDITTHPLKRLEYQIFTYIDPEYDDSYWDESEKEFLYNLTSLLRKEDHQYELEYGLLKNFHSLILQEPSINRSGLITKNKAISQLKQVWHGIIENSKDNYWFFHNLALLHQEWAEEFEDQKNKELAKFHWERSRKCWFHLYPRKEFWKYFRANNPEINGKQFITFINNFPNTVLDIHKIRLQEYLHKEYKTFAQIHFNCIKLAQRVKYKEIRSAANKIIENLTSKFLQEAKEKLNAGKLPEGIRENYESAINHVNTLLELDPDNKRALMFVVEKYNGWAFDLYTIDNRDEEVKIADKSKPFAKKLARRINKGQGFLRENQIVAENLLMQGHSSDDLHKSINLFKEALEYNPEYDNAKQLLKESQIQLQFKTYERTLKRANEAWQRGNDDGVINCLKKIPSNFIGYDEVKKFLAAAYNRRGVNKINSIFRLDSSDLLSLLKNKNVIESQLNDAIDDLKNALRYDPHNQQIKDNLEAAEKNLVDIKAIQSTPY